MAAPAAVAPRKVRRPILFCNICIDIGLLLIVELWASLSCIRLVFDFASRRFPLRCVRHAVTRALAIPLNRSPDPVVTVPLLDHSSTFIGPKPNRFGTSSLQFHATEATMDSNLRTRRAWTATLAGVSGQGSGPGKLDHRRIGFADACPNAAAPPCPAVPRRADAWSRHHDAAAVASMVIVLRQ